MNCIVVFCHGSELWGEWHSCCLTLKKLGFIIGPPSGAVWDRHESTTFVLRPFFWSVTESEVLAGTLAGVILEVATLN